ncbi:hypothetical protein [Methylosinus sp. PW1]|uniref:hypothetical protein n=1 Tax=Methylosinus sp. PW1 TaxID=107636 RepID=UPI00055EA7A3|nr:hypothetical protein [Methylosinus sp. PW1]
MPPIDLAALNAAQSKTVDARLALSRVEQALNAARGQKRVGEAALAAARASGDQPAADRARRAIQSADGAIEAATRGKIDLSDQLRQRLDEIVKIPFDAPADVPLLLTPLRLETRFGISAAGTPILKIRIYPDDILVDRTDPGLTETEEEAARAYWSTLFAAPDDNGVDAPWAALKKAVGRNRARWAAMATRPTNPQARGTGAQPIFPETKPAARAASRPRLLPDRFLVTAWQAGKQLRAQGLAVAVDLKIGLLADDGSALVDQNGLKVLEGTEWLVDYDRALATGMAIELPLDSDAPIERLFVYGVSLSRNGADAAAELEALLAAHDGEGRLDFIPQGAPTNNTEAGAAGWRRWSDPAPVLLTPPAPATDANAAVTASALGVSAGVLAGVEHAGLREQGAAAAMNAALWPATWGYFLETLDQHEKGLSPFVIEDARAFHQTYVRGRGALPAIRVGDQPYGLLPFAGFARRFKPLGAGGTEAGLEMLLRRAWPNWLNGAGGLPRIQSGGGAAKVLEIYGHAPLSWGVRARKCLSKEFIDKIEATTSVGKESSDIEDLLTRLLAETLGGFSFIYGVGSLAAESRPVMLPYADPARDADYAEALIGGGNPGAISSVFQALITLGWNRVKSAATPSRLFPDAVRATATLQPALAERVIGAVMQDGPGRVGEFDVLIGDVTEVVGEERATPPPIFRPITLGARDFAAMTVEATSTVERDRFGAATVAAALRDKRRLADLAAGLKTLIDLSRAPGGADLTALVAETLDTASHRLDAWICGLSTARLARLRQAQPKGLTVGAFGWLFDLAPQNRKLPEGGFVAAPALELATTAGLLRSAYIAHNPADGTGGAFAIDLSSARVRRALWLLEGVSNGQPLAALFGYEFERRLHEADCDRFILTFRGLAPLVAGKLNITDAPTSDPESAQVVAAANVTDMLRLLDIWNDPARGPKRVFDALAARPTGNEYLDPNVHWDPPTKEQMEAVTAAVANAAEDADALADLLLAESVHQLAQGNMARASAVLDASGRGEAPPPADPAVIQSHGPGTVVTHRVIVATTETEKGGWSAATPRALSNPALEAWAGRRLGDPKRVILGKSGEKQAKLADAGLGALDFVALCRHPNMLDRTIRARAPLADSSTAFQDAKAFEELVLTGAALQQVLDGARSLGSFNIGIPGTDGWGPAPGAVAAAKQRLSTASGMLQARLTRLQSLMSGANVARADLMAALLDLGDFGVVLPDLADKQAADLAHLAVAEAVGRLTRAQEALAAPATPATLDKAAEALFGSGFPLPLPYVFTPPNPGDAIGERAVSEVAPGAAERYLADVGCVRAPIGVFQRLNLLSGVAGAGPSLTIRQLCAPGDDPPDHWIGDGLPPDRPSPMGAVVSILADAPAGLDFAKGVAGLLIDDWTEIMPRRIAVGANGPAASRTTAGVAIHADAPRAEPPQTLVLAISPDGERWTEDSLCDFLSDLLDMARIRLVTLETLPAAPRILPAIYTQSWSLQGETVIDWSKIILDARLAARVEGLKNFTLTKEA